MNTGVWRLFDDLRTLHVVVIHPPGEDRGVWQSSCAGLAAPFALCGHFPRNWRANQR